MRKIIFCLLVINAHVSMAQKGSYRLLGEVKGFENNSWLYFDDVTTGQYILFDSVQVKNSKFLYTGTVKDFAQYIAVRDKEYNNKRNFWVEKGQMIFEAEIGKFDDAVVEGSSANDLAEKLYDGLRNTKGGDDYTSHFIKANQNSIVAMFELSNACNRWNKSKLKLLFAGFRRKLKQSYYGKRVSEFLKYSKDIKLGDMFTDFKMKDTSGKMLSLSAFKGKIILLDFWGTWCEGCVEQFPELKSIYEQFNDKGFQIVAVAAETKKDVWVKEIKRQNLTWINLSDLKGDKNLAAIIYGVRDYPTNFLIDKSGKIIAKDISLADLKLKLQTELP
jgi:peroxiredoxin